MISEFSPSDRERDSADPLWGCFAGAHFAGDSLVDPTAVEMSDHWIDEALRAVPLPEGFLTRMSLLAQSAQSDTPTGNLA